MFRQKRRNRFQCLHFLTLSCDVRVYDTECFELVSEE